jgi:hypothetical protein
VTNMHKAYAGLLVVVGIAALARILSVGIGSKAQSAPEAGNFKVSTFTSSELRHGQVGTIDWLKIQSTDDRDVTLERVELNKNGKCTLGNGGGTTLRYGEVAQLMINPFLPGCKDALEVSVQSDKGMSFYNFD